VEERRERCAFASRREITRTEVGYYATTGSLGNDTRVANLKRSSVLGVVRNRLPMRGDRIDLSEPDARTLGHGGGSRREPFGEFDIEPCKFSERFRPRNVTRSERVNSLLQIGWEHSLDISLQFETALVAVVRPLHERSVDAIC